MLGLVKDTRRDNVLETTALTAQGEEDVIEDPVACYLCGETVLPGQDYKVHLATAHRLTKVQIDLVIAKIYSVFK